MSDRPKDDTELLARCFTDIAEAILAPRNRGVSGCPPGRPDAGTIYTNFDHTFDDEVRRLVESEECVARHAAWEFNAIVWKDGEQWFSEVSRFGSVQEVFVGDTAESVIQQANEEYGGD